VLLLLLTPNHHGREFHSQVLLVAVGQYNAIAITIAIASLSSGCSCRGVVVCAGVLVYVHLGAGGVTVVVMFRFQFRIDNAVVVAAVDIVDVVIVAATISGRGRNAPWL